MSYDLVRWIDTYLDEGLTVTAAQRSEVICDAIQVILVRRSLRSRVVSRQLLPAVVHTRWEWWGHVVGEIEILQWIVDEGLDFVREVPFGGESLQVDQEDRRQPRQRKRLRCFPHRLAMGTIPAW